SVVVLAVTAAAYVCVNFLHDGLPISAPEVTVAVSVTVWSAVLNVAVLSAAVVVVPALLTVSVFVLSELSAKLPVGPLVYAASIEYVFAALPPGSTWLAPAPPLATPPD